MSNYGVNPAKFPDREDLDRMTIKFLRARLQEASNLSSFEYQRLMAWMKDTDRKPADTAFTSGVCRDAARAFESSGIAEKLQEAEKVIDRCEEILKKSMECCGCDELYTGISLISEYRKGKK